MLLDDGSVEVCMKVHVGRTTLLLASVVTVAAGAISARPVPPTAAKTGIGNTGVLAKSAVKILQENCVACHTGANPSGKLDLSSRAGLLRGGVSGASFSKTKPEGPPVSCIVIDLRRTRLDHNPRVRPWTASRHPLCNRVGFRPAHF